jgi:hypothetical protein
MSPSAQSAPATTWIYARRGHERLVGLWRSGEETPQHPDEEIRRLFEAALAGLNKAGGHGE